MQVEVKAKYDKSGSEGLKNKHFTFGREKGASVKGGVYIDRSVPLPDKIIIVLREETEDA